MYTQKLAVHNRSEGEGAEGIEACVIDFLGIFVFTYITSKCKVKIQSRIIQSELELHSSLKVK